MKLNKNHIGLLGSCLMNNILYMFLNTFMVAYFITLTNYNYQLISVYYIISFVFILLTFLLLGRIIKNKNQIWIFRIGIILHCIYVLTIALLKENIINYYIFLGAFYGIVQGFFWSTGHTLINEHVGKNSNKFVSINTVLDKIFEILFPIIFGVSIELTSFSYVAKIVIIISLTQLIFSFLVSDNSAISKHKYNLKEYRSKFKDNEKLNNYYKMICCDGIVNYLLETLIVIIIVMTFKKTISLGFITTIFAICSIISIYLFQNKIKNKKKMLSISSIGMIISVIFLLLNINKFTVIIYNLCVSIFLVILSNRAQAKRYTIISNIKEIEKDYLVEHQVFSEVCLNITRIISYTVLFIASLFNNMILFKVLLILVTIIILLYSKLIIKLEEGEK